MASMGMQAELLLFPKETDTKTNRGPRFEWHNHETGGLSCWVENRVVDSLGCSQSGCSVLAEQRRLSMVMDDGWANYGDSCLAFCQRSTAKSNELEVLLNFRTNLVFA